MNKVYSIIIACLLVLGMTSAVSALEAVNMDGNLPTIDGNMDDWAWVPDYYHYTMTDDFWWNDGAESEGLEDYDFDIMLGWSAENDAVYIMLHISDDDHVVDVGAEDATALFDNDMLGWRIQHNLGETMEWGEAVGSTGFNVLELLIKCGDLYLPAIAGYPAVLSGMADQLDAWNLWYFNPPYGDVAYTIAGSERYVEIKFTIFDWWAYSGPAASTPAGLQAGDILWNLCYPIDQDGWDAETETMAARTTWLPLMDESLPGSGFFLELMASETAVERTSWGAIKTLFK